MGERGSCGACLSLAGSMYILAVAIGLCGCLLEGIISLRGARTRLFRTFPLFYSYIVYSFCACLALYLTYWLAPRLYPSVYWIYYLISLLAEFAILVEISDQIFRPLPVIRNLGRALSVPIAAAFGLFYILPGILGPTGRSRAISDFLLRTSVAKAVILVVLFYAARHFNSQLGRNLGGLMLGFSIYVALNVAMMGSARAFASAQFAHIFWFIEPLSSLLCLLVWTISLWEISPVPNMSTTSRGTGMDPGALALELTRFNSELSKIMHK